MTLAEFLHPVRNRPKRVAVLAALYYFKHEEDVSEMTTGEVKKALVKAQVPRARKANISDVLAKLVPWVDRVRQGRWEITTSGEERVRAWLSLGDDEPAKEDVSSLEHLSEGLENDAARDYVDEAILCLRAGARRAAVVFLWAGGVHEIREQIWRVGTKKDIETALQVGKPKARFRKKDDFSLVKDSALIDLAGHLSVFDQSERKRLTEALNLRNDCGHPVKYKPGEKKVSSFIEDVLQVVFGARF